MNHKKSRNNTELHTCPLVRNDSGHEMGNTIDISLDGLLLLGSIPFNKGQVLNLHVFSNFPNTNGAILSIEAMVHRCIEKDDGKYETGF